MNIAPKIEFQRGQFSKLHAELVITPLFQNAIQSALLQMIYDEGSTADPTVAAASWHRVAGARAFIHVLLNLSEPPPEKKIEPRTNIWPKQ